MGASAPTRGILRPLSRFAPLRWHMREIDVLLWVTLTEHSQAHPGARRVPTGEGPTHTPAYLNAAAHYPRPPNGAAGFSAQALIYLNPMSAGAGRSPWIYVR